MSFALISKRETINFTNAV